MGKKKKDNEEKKDFEKRKKGRPKKFGLKRRSSQGGNTRLKATHGTVRILFSNQYFLMRKNFFV